MKTLFSTSSERRLWAFKLHQGIRMVANEEWIMLVWIKVLFSSSYYRYVQLLFLYIFFFYTFPCLFVKRLCDKLDIASPGVSLCSHGLYLCIWGYFMCLFVSFETVSVWHVWFSSKVGLALFLILLVFSIECRNRIFLTENPKTRIQKLKKKCIQWVLFYS